MSIFTKAKSFYSKAKSATKNYFSNVVGGAKIVGSALGSAYNSVKKKVTGRNQTGAVLNARIGENMSPAQTTQAYKTLGISTTNKNAPSGFNPLIGGGNIGYAEQTGQYYDGSSNGGSSNGGSSNDGSSNNTYLYPGQFGGDTTPRRLGGGQKTSNVDQTFFNPVNTSTITPSTLGSDTSGNASAGASVGAGAGGGMNTPSNPSSVKLPPPPTYSDPGAITLEGLNTQDTKINPDTGLFDTQGNLNQQSGNELTQALESLKEIPQKESIYDNPLIKEQNAEVQRQRQEVANWQGQLNAIVAKQQQDLLRHEKEISLAGGTVEGFSGRAAAINREAAFAALPIQAQLATAQNNLELAQDYLSELTSMVKEEIDNNYTYKVAKYNAVREIADKKEKKILDDLEKKETKTYNESRDNLSLVDAWMKEAVKTQQPNLINRLSKLDIYSSNFREKLAGIIGQLREPAEASEKAKNEPLNISDISRYQELYPDAGVIAGDTEAQANAKVAHSNTPEDKTRTLIQEIKDGGGTYDEVIKEIGNNQESIKIANEIFGQQESKKPFSLIENPFIDSLAKFLFQ